MVLEKMVAAPTTRLSVTVSPAASPTPKPKAPKTAELARVVRVTSENSCTSFWGCRFIPSRYSRKMMPMVAACLIRSGLTTQPRAEGPNRIPSRM